MKKTLLLTAAIGLIVGSVSAQSVLTNGDFEDDGAAGVSATGWDETLSGGTGLTSTDYAQSGTYSLAIDSTGAGAWNSPNVFQNFTGIAPGTEWNFSGYMLMPTSAPITDPSFGLLKVEFYDVGGARIDTAGNVSIGGSAAGPFFGAESAPFINNTSVADTWIFTETQVVAPAGTVAASFFLLNVNEGTTPSPIYFDGVSAVLVPEPGTYAAILGLLALGFVAYRRRR